MLTQYVANMESVEPERISGRMGCLCGCETDLAITQDGYIEIGNEGAGYLGIWIDRAKAYQLIELLYGFLHQGSDLNIFGEDTEHILE